MTASSMDEKPRACLDAGMLVAMALGTIDMHYDGAVRVCDAAVRSGFQLITSRLAVMEMINITSRRTAMLHKCRPGSREDLSATDAHVRKAVAYALNLLNIMEQQGDLSIIELEGWPADLAVLQSKLIECQGRIVPGVRNLACRHCGVGPHDLIQYTLAKAVGALVICTTDAALADIAGRDDEFGRIHVQVTGRPLIGPLSGSASRS